MASSELKPQVRHAQRFCQEFLRSWATALGVLFLIEGSALAETRLNVPSEGSQALRLQLQDLKQMHYSNQPSDLIISRYEQLIEDFGDRPEVAEAMYHLARFYRSKDLDRQKMIHWFRQSVEVAETDSWAWSEARFDLAGQLRWMKDDANSVREARTLVEQVAAKRPDQILTMARVQS